ncbi:MAG TPA: phosphoenolpyruvate synthase, partial [Methanocorpusculum sp.]|nr:phosphoenolpyruvate synthase [Methanocorpusculum sp.]
MILWLNEIHKEDLPLVGGKGASLGELTSIGLPVPNAFVVTAQTFRLFLEKSGIDKIIFPMLTNKDVTNIALLNSTADKVRSLVENTKIPAEIQNAILEGYHKLGTDTVVAVRSSATAEDLPEASFAGQQDTYLNIKGDDDVIDAVRRCWASLYTARAIYYRSKNGFDDRSVNIAVVVQKLVYSDKAGVMFSSHPVTGEPVTIIEGSFGLGEAVVSGNVSPDNYVFDKKTKKILKKNIAVKSVEILPDKERGTKLVEIEPERQTKQVLDDDEICSLATFADISENHYGCPQDLEWSMVNDTIYILQSRPITTICKPNTDVRTDYAAAEKNILLQGYGASPGVVSGKAVLVMDMQDLSKITEGQILVATMTNPDMVPAMKKVAGIITDEGGMTCHAAIVSRELGTPAVVGTKQATKLLKDGQIVTIDGEKGLIYEGNAAANPAEEQTAVQTAAAQAAPVITATYVKVNVSMPEAAKRAAATGADGVGLLRIEHLIIG